MMDHVHVSEKGHVAAEHFIADSFASRISASKLRIRRDPEEVQDDEESDLELSAFVLVLEEEVVVESSLLISYYSSPRGFSR
eukprot:8007559-Heterocapsa_arctica.AAC.1